MIIFAKTGSREQVIDYQNSVKEMDGYIVMQEQRPHENYIAKSDGTWVKDTRVVVPCVISRFQAMSVLEETEITYNNNKVMIATAVQSYVDSLDSSTEANRAIKRAWNFASEFERNSSTISAIATLLSLTSKQVDDMFIAAAKIKG